MTLKRIAAIIVAAGTGTRSGSPVPKQFAPLAGRPMVAYSLSALRTHPAIDEIVIVTGADQQAMLNDAVGDVWYVPGGETRRESVLAGLEALALEGGARHVLIHDAARPFLSHGVIDRLLDALRFHRAAVPVLPVADTLAVAGEMLGDAVPREHLVRVQTPQAFHFDAILAAHRNWPDMQAATDDAQIARAAGISVASVEGERMLEKITYPADFRAAETALADAFHTRTGMGFDVHRLVSGEELWLGGIRIDHDKGLSGHSDADVALHAVTDALLGAAGAGDIGTHFPPSDPQWRGAPSSRFLEHARDLVAAAGGRIDFIDLTIICEAPRIGPYRDAMRACIAGLLRVAETRISIKATTTERLGFTGRGEGIAAQAAATIRIAETAR
ncbi:bifunctional 2-C-methyl-D-erythritol 4-phosphate cytidylyltransferase/2-C-methyl-D-erythritol 2,4-cyclodiphosphate synthase [Stakelama sp. CBK3Z-3]|uniref:Bifunctional enzyme IspD/IspF n=1 Tax=Stakelama flava TaxID=2860338 RepID=A0ABS6XL81_9SPHN|nr:bifunctional 2-C-methyl-D-erythritol 4-phosphate cytidylyltransferase/2-C-methyl-D-erythritol 2,4-cyclodiphosphate synthase [Stakelama flava]MBW4330940.1 bifunctional 2-C-methyl-D-erythritol 4-phosphate cytidylyltransferase/2-C-methyl-D-erythritol 2,4-cyclodiphosphate synthase [Stakelama flava]